jgi:hypothetical protein
VIVDVEVIEGVLNFAVPVTVQGLADGATASLDGAAVVVQLAGPLPLLNAIGPGAIAAFVDASGVAPGPFDLPVGVLPPRGVSLLSVQPATVSGTIEVP